jgi:eukaryotic-like serine/threonine-protein kinase
MKSYIKYSLAFISFCITILLLFVVFDTFLMPLLVHDREIVSVPNITGMEIKKAGRILEENLFDFKISGEQFSEKFPPGTVIRQFPRLNSKVKTGRTIYLTVSKGNELVSVPYLIGNNLRSAKLFLMRKGLTIGNISYQNHDSIGVDTIFSQSIRSGAELPYGSSIDVVISIGPVNQVSVPQLFSKSYDEAIEILNQSNLSLGNVSYIKEGTFIKNTVLTQLPLPGTLVPRNSFIDITLTK